MMKCKTQSTKFLRRPLTVVGSYGLGLILSVSLAACATGKWPSTTEFVRESPKASAAGTATEPIASRAPVVKPAQEHNDVARKVETKPSRELEETGNQDNEVLPPKDSLNSVYFPLGSYALDREAAAAIKRHAEKLMGDPHLSVTLIGHTDDLGSREYNNALSIKRARAVEKALLDLGVASRQIRVSNRYGYEKAPSRPCRTDACRKLLRRVEFR